MIVYPSHSFGIHSLLRVHGSAVYKCLIPALVSTVLLLLIVLVLRHETIRTLRHGNDIDRATTHPLVIGVFVAFYSLLVAFRLNFAYGRYWDGATAIHTMMSRWLDGAISMAAFHYQCTFYQTSGLQPLAFGNHDNTKLHNLTRERERRHEMTLEETMKKYQTIMGGGGGGTNHTTTTSTTTSNNNSSNYDDDNITSTLRRRRWFTWSPHHQDHTHNHHHHHSHHLHAVLDTEQVEHFSIYQKKVFRNSSFDDTTITASRTSTTTSTGGGVKNPRRYVRQGSSIPVPDSYLEEEENDEEKSETTRTSRHHKNNSTLLADTTAADGGVGESLRSRKMRMSRQVNKGSTFLLTALSKAPIPSLFLQELAHLMSLLSAVAMSTLQNPLEGTESPLIRYVPNKPWPPVDPSDRNSSYYASQQRRPSSRQQDHPQPQDHDHHDHNEHHDHHIRTKLVALYHERLEHSFMFLGQRRRLWTWLVYLLGLDRFSPSQRTVYHAARPFSVLGGVSDEEIDHLQRARGPFAKVGLCMLWVQEFMTREYLAGSAGKVGPPIFSDILAQLSHGLTGYNAARRISYIPFPFPHAQIEVFFSLTVLVVFPFLYASYVNRLALACVINFATVICFLGMSEVSRELENPFINVPNDLPLLHFQAQYNEALICMFAGFHPDSWWEEEGERKTTAHS